MSICFCREYLSVTFHPSRFIPTTIQLDKMATIAQVLAILPDSANASGTYVSMLQPSQLVNVVSEPQIAALREVHAAITKYLSLLHNSPVNTAGMPAPTFDQNETVDEPSTVNRKPTQDRSIFRFQDLPPEIRNIIYSYTLIDDSPITISRHIDFTATEKAKKDPTLIKNRLPGQKCIIYEFRSTVRRYAGKSPRTPWFGELHGSAIVRVSKAISEEARPILYGKNHFIFKTATTFEEFFDRSNAAFHLFQSVEFQESHSYHVGPFTSSLRLSKLSLHCKYNLDLFDIVTFATSMALCCGCRDCYALPPCPRRPGNQELCYKTLPSEQRRRLQALEFHGKSGTWTFKNAFNGIPHDRLIADKELQDAISVFFTA